VIGYLKWKLARAVSRSYRPSARCSGADVTLGWFNALRDDLKARVYEYLGTPHEAMPWPLIRAALASVSQLALALRRTTSAQPPV